MTNKRDYPKKLLWVDLEMTGLNPRVDRILEIGLIITNFDFKELATYEAVVYQPPEVLDLMKQAPFYEYKDGKKVKIGTVYDIASKNGLVAKVADGKDEKQVESEVVKLVSKHFEGPVVLAGNSIHQDRRFIRQWWPKLDSKLHYRMLDVSSFKIIMQGQYGIEFQKPNNHRALEDIRGSIAELTYYLNKLKQSRPRGKGGA